MTDKKGTSKGVIKKDDVVPEPSAVGEAEKIHLPDEDLDDVDLDDDESDEDESEEEE